MNTNADVPEELLRAVVSYFKPQRVILFGSRARGDAHEDSDLDLLVVVDDDTSPEKLTLEAGFRSALSFPRATDVIPCRAQTFDRRKKIVGTLCFTADGEGVVVYERA
jgi:predicted nucleotidyltransferase